MTSPASAFLDARAFLLRHREDYATAYRDFRWPVLTEFNWALDYFDEFARGNDQPGLWLVSDHEVDTKLSFAELSARSNQVANFLRRHGIRRGDRLLVMLPNVAAMWETMLAAMKLGAVVIPTASLLTPSDLRDRIDRGRVKLVLAASSEVEKFASIADHLARVTVGDDVPGWVTYDSAYQERTRFEADGATHATDPLMLYFTSGTTALPKLVMHSHQSYPFGHLATMYWIGLKPGDLHLNISSPGWAKHAWSSLFAPWNAGATIFVHQYSRFVAHSTLAQVARCGVTTLCAPPTVWRMCVLEDLASYPVSLREIVSAGEPLNPEIIQKVQSAWGVTVRDGFGQTESVCLIGNCPGQPIRPGSVGRPTPGHDIALLDSDGGFATDGEISVGLNPRPLSLFQSYVDDEERTHQVMTDGYYRTGDLATRDPDGSYRYVGRTDDVFKSSDYRVSPGASIPNGTALTFEYMPTRRRAALVTLMFCNISIGAFTAGFTAPYIIAAWGWHGLFIVGGVVPLFACFLLLLSAPESLRFLATHRPDDTRIATLLSRLAPGTTATSVKPEAQIVKRQSIFALLTAEYRLRTGLLWCAFALNLFVLYMLISWIPTLLRGAGWSTANALRGVGIINAGGVVGGLLLSWFVDRNRMLPAILIAYIAVAISLALFTVLPSGSVWWALLLVIGGGTAGTQMTLNALAAALYPPVIRATGVGWATSIGRIGGAVAPLLGAAVVGHQFRAVGVLGLLVVPVLACAVAITLLSVAMQSVRNRLIGVIQRQ